MQAKLITLNAGKMVMSDKLNSLSPVSINRLLLGPRQTEGTSDQVAVQPAKPGDSIEPGVERSGTPG